MTDAVVPGLQEAQLTFGDVAVGGEIPVFTLPLTLQRLVMEAGVNRDFTPLHHDAEDTRRTGAPNAYANTMFIQAMLEATLRSWMGDRGRLHELRVRMISFNLVGTLLTAGGRVAATKLAPGNVVGTVDLEVWMRSCDVLTVTGSAVVTLPVAAATDGRAQAATDGRGPTAVDSAE